MHSNANPGAAKKKKVTTYPNQTCQNSFANILSSSTDRPTNTNKTQSNMYIKETASGSTTQRSTASNPKALGRNYS